MKKIFFSSCLYAVCFFSLVLFYPISVNALTITVSNPFRYLTASVTYSATDNKSINNYQTGLFNSIADAKLSSPDGIHPLETYALQVTTIDILTSEILHAFGYLQVYSSLPAGSSGYAYAGLVIPFSVDDIASYTYSVTDAGAGYRALLVSGNNTQLPLSSGTLQPGQYTFEIDLIAPSFGLPTFDFEVTEAGSTAPVPEPSTFLLFGAGLGGFALYRRRMKK